jgi:hypothetical protein
MIVPEIIKNKMHRVAKLNYKAAVISREVDNYFIEQGFEIEDLRSGNGVSLEELDLGNDVTDAFCEWFEKHSD